MRAHMLAAGTIGALALVGCDDTLFYGHSAGGEVPSGTDYCAVETVVANNCTVCHSPSGGNQGALDLETDLHATVVDNVGYYGVTLVVPGDPEGSLFYQKTTDTQPDDGSLGGVMPIGSTGLSDAENSIIYDWISAGASEECSDATTTTDDTGTTGTTDDTGTTGDTGDTGAVEASWAAMVDLFDAQCVSCHSASLAPTYSYLDLETDPYSAIVGVWSTEHKDQIQVVVGVPEESFLYLKSVGDQEKGQGASMPFGSTVSNADAQLIYDWIKSGATQD